MYAFFQAWTIIFNWFEIKLNNHKSQLKNKKSTFTNIFTNFCKAKRQKEFLWDFNWNAARARILYKFMIFLISEQFQVILILITIILKYIYLEQELFNFNINREYIAIYFSILIRPFSILIYSFIFLFPFIEFSLILCGFSVSVSGFRFCIQLSTTIYLYKMLIQKI